VLPQLAVHAVGGVISPAGGGGLTAAPQTLIRCSRQEPTLKFSAFNQRMTPELNGDANVARVDDIKHLFDTVLDTYGRLDIVVANAGIELVAQSVIDFTEADFDRLFAVNAKGAFFTLQRAARHVADNGWIIYIGTSNTAFPLPGRALYGGSKIAAQFLVQVLAKELGHRGVAVNSILPTAIEGAGVFTDGVRSEVREFVKSFRPMQRMGTVEDVANAAEYLAGDLSGFVSGQHLMVSGGPA
jgi:3-oxoacyl-[acyl-carrier protein] reductase